MSNCRDDDVTRDRVIPPPRHATPACHLWFAADESAHNASLNLSPRSSLLPVLCHRAVLRLLKISGRLLQAALNQVSRPDQGLMRERSGDLSSTTPSPSSEPGSSDRHGRGERASTTSPHSNGQHSTAHAAAAVASTHIVDGGGEGTPRNLRTSLAQLSSSTRLDFANRYLEVRRVI